jgi:hypothetical protein
MTFPIITIKDRDKLEQLGTKTKFWFYNDGGTFPQLFKIGRLGTGENWSEKVTSELAKLIGIPSASYEFAEWQNEQGVATPSFVPENGRLIHGNEILAKSMGNYETNKFYKVRDYTINSVIGVLKLLKDNVSLPIGYDANDDIQDIGDLFVGYVLFDCLISNPDRHHENWGIVFDTENRSLHLAPTYDHASGLGCRVSENECRKRLTTMDRQYSVSHFVSRTRSSFYNKDNKRIKTLDAFLLFAKYHKAAATFWIDELNKLNEDAVRNIFSQIPDGFVNNYSVEFACKILQENKKRLIGNRGLINS